MPRACTASGLVASSAKPPEGGEPPTTIEFIAIAFIAPPLAPWVFVASSAREDTDRSWRGAKAGLGLDKVRLSRPPLVLIVAEEAPP